MKSSSEEVIASKRSPRRRASTKRVSNSSDKPTLRRRPSRPVAEKKATPEVSRPRPVKQSQSSGRTRKAPTPISDAKAEKSLHNKQKMMFTAFLLVGVALSAAVGLSDTGQIDVVKTIEDRNERIRNNTTDDRDTIISNVELPVQNTAAKSGGGLRPATPEQIADNPTRATKPVATTTATSSDQVASDTESETATSTPIKEEDNSEQETSEEES